LQLRNVVQCLLKALLSILILPKARIERVVSPASFLATLHVQLDLDIPISMHLLGVVAVLALELDLPRVPLDASDLSVQVDLVRISVEARREKVFRQDGG